MPTPALPSRKSQALPFQIETGSLQRYIKAWILDSRRRGLSPGTVSNRTLITDKLLWWLNESDATMVDLSTIKGFLDYVSNGHMDGVGRWGNKHNDTAPRPSTSLMYHARLRTLFAYMVEEEYIDQSPFTVLKPPVCREDQIQPFTAAQVTAMLRAAQKSPCPRRNHAIVLTLLDTGLRASELCSLKMADVDFTEAKLSVIGKGNKRRSVPFGVTVRKALLSYLKENPHEDHEPLIFAWDETSCRLALTRSGLTQLIRRLGVASHLTGVRPSPHTFRHTMAVEFLRNGGNQFTLMTILGHTDMKQTKRYVMLAQADIESQHRQFSPADRMKLR